MTTYDLAVIGSGIVGIAHALEAVDRGLSVVVLDRDERPTGASIRNFGHICTTAQDGPALTYALRARQRWLAMAAKAGFWLSEAGTVVLARAEDERDLLAEFAAERGDDQVRLLDADEVRDRLPVRSPDVVGGAWLPLDLRVDPREAVTALVDWLAGNGVEFRWRANVLGLGDGVVRTARGDVSARAVVVAVGHDVDRLLPDLADEAGVRRCVLHMLRVAAPDGAAFGPAALTGLSMLRYPGLASRPSAARVRERIAATRPDLLDVAMNLMFTQAPDGDLVIGDTHHYSLTEDPFADESVDELVLRETSALLGVPGLAVRRRWRGVYASSEKTDFLVAAPRPGVRVVSVTSGIGMTTAFGLAPDVLDDLSPGA